MHARIRHRTAGARDMPAVKELLEACGLHGVDPESASFIVANAGDDLVACAALEQHGSQGLLRSLAVHPDHRNQGLGRQLVWAVEQAAWDADIDQLLILTTTAARFFRRLGFIPVDRSSVTGPVTASLEFRALCPQDAVTLIKTSASVGEAVTRHYGQRARGWLAGDDAPCCLDACRCTADETDCETALGGSQGCGCSPVDSASIRDGETVLDLGSGAGLEVLRAAGLVGPAGRALGLEADPDMLEVALLNRSRSGASNVDFIAGHMESIPLDAHTVDVAISNCVINLSSDKERVFLEVWRVLRPGGRLVISDIVHLAPLPYQLALDPAAWADCLSGTLSPDEFRWHLEQAGFDSIAVSVDEAGRFQDVFAPALVTATKPADNSPAGMGP